jgi:tetratricopeptide (TPR) repeat protein
MRKAASLITGVCIALLPGIAAPPEVQAQYRTTPSLGLELKPPCLTCYFKPPPGPPEVQVPKESEEQKDTRRRSQMERLRAEAQQHIDAGRLAPAIGALDRLLGLLGDEGPDGAAARAAIRGVRNQLVLNWGAQYLAEQKYAEALAAFERAEPSAAREEGAAKARFGLGQVEGAFARLDALAAHDAALATRLRGHFYEELGALPLAIEQYERVAQNRDVALYLEALEKRGLRRYEKSSHRTWSVYRAKGSRPARTLSYWFATASGGAMDYAHPAVLAVRPAPRKLTFGLVFRSLIRLRWPESATAREYSLTVHGSKRADLVAMWDREPAPEEITGAAARGFAALEPLKRAEELLHEKRPEGALQIALAEARTEGGFFPEQPNYAALVKAVQAAVEMRSDERARAIAEDIAGWHPMWGPLVLANAYEQAERPEAARAAYEEAIAAAPWRIEGYEKHAAFEWEAAKARKDAARADGFLRAQRAARRLEAFSPGAGLWLRAQIAAELQANSLTWALLQRLSGLDDAPEAALELQALLEALGQSRFASVGGALRAGNGLELRAYRTQERAPDDAALVHHSAEVLVFTPQGDLVETFALASQGVPPGAARQFMLDRINAFGLQPLRIYGARAPGVERILKGIAAL